MAWPLTCLLVRTRVIIATAQQHRKYTLGCSSVTSITLVLTSRQVKGHAMLREVGEGVIALLAHICSPPYTAHHAAHSMACEDSKHLLNLQLTFQLTQGTLAMQVMQRNLFYGAMFLVCWSIHIISSGHATITLLVPLS